MQDNKGSSRRIALGVSLAEAAVSLFLLSVLVIIVIGFFPESHKLLADKAAQLISEAGADHCSIGRVKVVAWRSIAFEDLEVVERVDSILSYRFHIASAEIDMNLFRLLLRRNKLRRIFFPGDTDLLRELYDEPALITEKIFLLKNEMADATQAVFSGIRIWVKLRDRQLIRCINGEMSFRESSEEPDNIDVELAVARMNVVGDGLEDISCNLILKPSGDVLFDKLSARYFEGRIRGEARINPARNLVGSYSLVFDKIDLGYWYAVHVGTGKVSGRAALHIEGGDVPLDQITSRVSLHGILAPCSIEDLPVQQSLATSLFIPSLSSLGFSKVSINALMDTTDTVHTTIRATGDQVDFDASGWIMRNGPLQQQINGTFSEQMVGQLPPIVAKTLMPSKDDGRMFTCRLFGTFSDPRFELDEEILRRAVGSLFEEASRELIELHRKHNNGRGPGTGTAHPEGARTPHQTSPHLIAPLFCRDYNSRIRIYRNGGDSKT